MAEHDVEQQLTPTWEGEVPYVNESVRRRLRWARAERARREWQSRPISYRPPRGR